MNLEAIDNKKNEFQSVLTQIQLYRDLWQNEKKELIIKTLTSIKKAIDLEWQIQVLDMAKNSETINIAFNPARSGISENNGSSMRSFVKEGGALLFCQAYNGEIFVLIMYPYINEIVSRKENTFLGKFKPDQITEEFICAKVEKFLDEMIKWEKSNYGNKVGFVIEQ